MGERVGFASNGGRAEGYLAVPGPDRSPAVVVIQEWWGLVPHVERVADRVAAEGFLALAPDLYHGVAAREPDEATRLVMGRAMDTAARDVAGAAGYLAGRSDSAGPAAAVGFCMGGSLALWSATIADGIRAAVGCYPALPWERMPPAWGCYRGKAALIHCSEGDGGSAAPGIREAVVAIEAAGGTATTYDYPRTQHGFFNDTRRTFAPEAAAAAWARTVAFLCDRLG
jgi:carboxymethylenebutenolidase